MKKFIKLMIVMCMLTTCFTVHAQDTSYFNEGGIVIKDKTLTTLPGQKVTLLVTPHTVDWLDESVRENRNGEDVVYFGSATVEADGSYSFEFYLAKSGKYNVYLTEGNSPTQTGKPDKISQITYINKTKNIEAISKLKTAVKNSTDKNTTQIADVIENYREGLGLYDMIFDDEKFSCQGTAQIAYDELSRTKEYEYPEITDVLEKSALAHMLNEKYDGAIKNYSYILFDDNLLYEQDDAEDIYDCMKGKDIQNLDELDKLLEEAVITVKANSGDTMQILNMLKDVFVKSYPEYKNKITSALCVEIAERKDWTVSKLESFIEKFSEKSQSGPSVSHGGGGGGGGGVSDGNKNVAVVPEFKEELDEFMPFNDIENVEWAHEAIIGLYNKGCINGRTAGIFAPDDSISREEFLKILISMFDLELVGSDTLPFEDVNKDEWYFSYVKTAYLAGVTKGISDNLFGIGRNITRQDLCKMTVNLTDALGKELEEKKIISFTDEEQISDYASEAVYRLALAGIISGNENGEFNPHANATRAEAAKILYYTMILVK